MGEGIAGSTSGGGETGGKAQVRAARETALLCVSLVPEVAAGLGNAGARGAGAGGPFAEGLRAGFWPRPAPRLLRIAPKHRGTVCAAARGLGGGANGQIPPDPGTYNVTLQIDGVLYLRIMDPYKASYGVEDPEYAVTQLAQTTMRSELGKLSLDKVFRERESLNASIVDAINQAADYWGIRCLRYEIKDIHVPPRVKESMQMQVEAERRKRATVLESEGTRESAINVAEGKKQAQILASEAEKAEQINQAAGEASAVLAKAKAKAEAIRILAAALTQHNGDAAASLTVAEQYVSAFSKLAKDSNTILLPSNPGDVTSMVAQAMGVYGALTKAPLPGAQDSASSGSSRDVQGRDASLDEEFDRVKLS
ncbi:stomatin-like protein 2, mitochondrial isoform X1 [Equus asinus]|uniref:stomatin-like protein 2, mitochondrial isoform X1 n=1 Tax=Equus asinus TaxID=9793 RepID=UPI00071A0526|nr:stomatin-like protein 2, mitochondrial isoform X1 [Equus asinus]XP_046534288.1 stomatin-like protein 2, mitochondrial isoform X1 [Equus quagga]